MKEPQLKVSLRPDIQGLRALAVIAVIVDHLFAWPSGGFVGVDVFFVLSGFLITSLLLREHQKTGRISFAKFYRRRTRRIIPLAVLVLLVTGAAAWLIFSTSRALSILVDEAWSLFFAANWHFAAIGTDYLQNSGPVSPVQHFWSLAVEEQFYIAWPWIIVLVLGVLASKRGWTEAVAVRWVLVVMVALTIISFAWALWDSVHSPTIAYFSTFSRAWELGLGAVVAVAAPVFGRLPSRVRPVLSWLGLGLIIVSLFAITPASTFPAPWALVPVVGSALIIVAGVGSETRFFWPLMNPVTSYLGNISYSLYLWHFPFIILLAAFFFPGDPLYYVIVLVATLGVSSLSYHLVEEPIRRSSWLEPNQPSYRWQQRFRAFTGDNRFRYGVPAVLAAICVALAVPFWSAAPVDRDYVSAAQLVSASAPATGPAATPEAALQASITSALDATSFPQTFTPSIDSLGTANWITAINAQGCGDISVANYVSCETGSGTAGKTVMVIGDSFGIAWMPAITAAFEPAGWKIMPFNRGQCPAASVATTADGGADNSACDAARQFAIDQVKQVKPDLVLLISATDTYYRLASKATDAAAQAEIEAGTAKTLAAVMPYTPRAVVLSDPPAGIALLTCVTRVSTPSDCISGVSTQWQNMNNGEKAAVTAAVAGAGSAAVAGAVAGAEFIDTRLWFCGTNDHCPGFVGTTPVRADTGHMTVEYSKSLGPVLSDALGISAPTAATPTSAPVAASSPSPSPAP